ncbi:MAG: glycosyltransferase family 2 protein [Anaerolineales bacterium]|nr:glycosyltransferase family 2 protein [Anaerolineales bacterium]
MSNQNNSSADLSAELTVSIVIVVWNSAKYLPRCLDSLLLQSFRDFEVILVDNNSSDDALSGLREKYPALDLRIERLNFNSGFSVANNIGARLARGHWLALLNPDAFPEPDWLEQLLRAAERHPAFSFFSSRQIQAERPDMLDGEGDAYHVSGLAWRRGYEMPFYAPGDVEEVFSPCAAAALYTRSEFLEVDGFDEDFFAYHEDVDLGFRLRLIGKRCLYVPQAVVRHVGSASSGKMSDFSVYHGHRNLIWSFFKNMPGWLFWAYLPLHILMNIYSMIRYSLNGRASILWRAKRDAVLGLPAFLAKRKNIQKKRKASASSIHAVMNSNWFEPRNVARRRASANGKKL